MAMTAIIGDLRGERHQSMDAQAKRGAKHLPSHRVKGHSILRGIAYEAIAYCSTGSFSSTSRSLSNARF